MTDSCSSSMMSSASRMTRKRKADVEQPDVMSTITKHQKRQKRRSSFMRGRSRKSLPSVHVECSEIHKKISTDLSEEKRFEKLKQECFEYTIQKLQAEIPLFEADQALQCRMRKAFEDTLVDVAETGMLKHATTKTSYEPNPANLEMNEVVIKIQSHIRRLTEEGEKWDKLLEDQTEAAKEAERLHSTESERKVPCKEPESLTIKQRRMLSELPDLAAIIDWAGSSARDVAIQIAKIHQTARQTASFKDCLQRYLQQELNQFALESFEGFKDITDPKSLLAGAGSNLSREPTGSGPDMQDCQT
ncbi:kinetochore-associated protein DSN1 homolog [Diadema setosum]|uniref:kinetochore-associated protein DSN1 homolog n=1 Tax=Diadema setosum TaxID=31175 RepID=UPI003B3BD04A